MAKAQEQIPLNIPRARIPLLELGSPMTLGAEIEEDLEELRIRVPNRVAAAVAVDPGAAVRFLASQGERMLAEITAKNKPAHMVMIDGKLKVPSADSMEGREGFPVNENPELYTKWETVAPPVWDGFWDVTDSRTGTLNARWWFVQSNGPMVWYKEWMDRGSEFHAAKGGLMHDEFIEKGYAWRGLREHPTTPYPVPPYWPFLLPDKAAVDGKYIKRSRVKEE